jgi:NAD(P)-dependent dehydrogenase (short-subunit alcohol dehydrogenase family)
MPHDLTGKIALVTGASRGIGAAVARKLAGAGAHVIMVARTVGGLEEIDDMIQEKGGSTTLVPLDLKDGPGIDRLGGAIAERWKHLDILVGNAAILGNLTPLGHIKPKVWDDLMAINVTANWRLIRALDPLLRAAKAGRAVFVTSGVAQHPRAYWGGYAISKAALEAMVKTWAAETATSNLKVNLINPGPVRTALRAAAMPGEDPATLPRPDDVAELFLEVCSESFSANGETTNFRDWQAARRKLPQS